MPRNHARIYVTIWRDADFRALAAEDQWTYIMLIAHPHLSWCGSMDYIPSRMVVVARDLTVETLNKSVERLEMARFVVVDWESSELLVRSYVRHDGIFSQPNIVKAMLRARQRLLSEVIRDALDAEIARAYRDEPEQHGFRVIETVAPDLWETLSGTLPQTLPGGPQ